MIIPIETGASQDDVLNVLGDMSCNIEFGWVSEMNMKPRASQKIKDGSKSCIVSGRDKICLFLEKQCGWSNDMCKQIPAKWVRYGHVVVLYGSSYPSGSSQDFLKALQQFISPEVTCVLCHTGPITGELRVPQMQLLTPSIPTVTLHIENKIKYKFDVMKVMFAPGNGTERIRVAKIKTTLDELVIDMFAGLGYFSLPLAKTNQSTLKQVISIEKKSMLVWLFGGKHSPK